MDTIVRKKKWNEENRLVGVVSPSAIIIEMTGKDQKEIEEIIQNAIDL